MNINVGLVDDHLLFRKSLEMIISSFPGFKVVVDAENGVHLREKIKCVDVPHIILVDMNMPIMDGVQTVKWLREELPSIRLAALSMNEEDHSIVGMLKAGVLLIFV